VQSHECPQGVVKQPYGKTAYVECECLAELCARQFCTAVLSAGADVHCGAVCSQVLRHWPCVWGCRDPGVVSTEGEENETEPPHLFLGRDRKGSQLDSGSPTAWLVTAPVF